MDGGKKILVLPVVFVALHLNYWMWDETRLVAGFPINLLYHLLLSLFLSAVMLVVVLKRWPRYLDEEQADEKRSSLREEPSAGPQSFATEGRAAGVGSPRR